MRIFKNTWFNRFAHKEGITDNELSEAVAQLEAGQFDADLGGGVFKIRLARSGEGKSGGYRMVIFFKSEDKAFYQYAFPKSARVNIDQGELRFFKKMAKSKLAMSENELNRAVNIGELIEIKGAI